MALPTTRTEFKNYCLRNLGFPVIGINVSDEQIEDRIDEALQYYTDYHFDATEKTFFKHQITATDLTNKYITLPDYIMGVVNIFDLESAMGSASTDMFNIKYQIYLNDVWTFMSSSMVPYYMTMQHLSLLQQLLVGQVPIRFNRHRNRLHIDTNWSNFQEGKWIIVEAYEVVDPDDFPDVWKDRWLLRYGTALIKRQMGNVLKKHTGMPMPGNIMFSGQQIYDEAIEEIEKLEAEMINSYSLPVSDMIGLYVPFLINISIGIAAIGALNEVWNYLPLV